MSRLADRIDEARHQLDQLPTRLADAHSLAYDRPGISYDRGGSRSSETPLPIRLTSVGYPHRHATAYDPAWATRHAQALDHLLTADQHATRAIEMLYYNARRPITLDPGRLCVHIDACLALITHRGIDQLDEPTRRELTRALTEIAAAVRRVPNMQPPAHAYCRNPRSRHQCGRIVFNRKRRLCASCDQAEKNHAQRGKNRGA